MQEAITSFHKSIESVEFVKYFSKRSFQTSTLLSKNPHAIRAPGRHGLQKRSLKPILQKIKTVDDQNKVYRAATIEIEE